MRYLLDNDLFFAAIYAGHAHHRHARSWLDREKPNGWAISTETWLAAMRLLMNPTVMKTSALKGEDAWNVVELEVSSPNPAKIIYAESPPLKEYFEKATGHRQVMDFWLVQQARSRSIKLASYDRALQSHWPEDVHILIPS